MQCAALGVSLVLEAFGLSMNVRVFGSTFSLPLKSLLATLQLVTQTIKFTDPGPEYIYLYIYIFFS